MSQSYLSDVEWIQTTLDSDGNPLNWPWDGRTDQPENNQPAAGESAPQQKLTWWIAYVLNVILSVGAVGAIAALTFIVMTDPIAPLDVLAAVFALAVAFSMAMAHREARNPRWHRVFVAALFVSGVAMVLSLVVRWMIMAGAPMGLFVLVAILVFTCASAFIVASRYFR